ncbi:MAG: SDR family NAD(P)-dependent oxidoreductase, partial [Verrucomicrobia bacterium]|nr:SDR family NAD(P)-dependent oxidoreductase [Verrucomicrobiota bacterium]
MASNARVLVTGAGGFIGSHVVEQLVAAGTRVTALVRYTSHGGAGHLDGLPRDVRSGIEVVRGDLRDGHFLMRTAKGADAIVHLAALIGIPYSYVAPSDYVATNVQGTLNVLEAARAHGVGRIVHISTSEVYGTAQYRPIDEKHPQVGQSPYSASKIGADKLAESYHRSFGVPVVTVRPFNTYGPRQSARAIVPTILSQL